jgi:transcriptional regulator with XRE-family HTH domain
MSKKRRQLTHSEQQDAARLKRVYRLKKSDLDLTQEKLAALMGFATQGAVSHYMNALIPMSNEVVLHFANHLRCDPTDIRPDIWDSLPMREAEGLDAAALDFARKFARLSPEDQELLKQTLDRISRTK